jgi:hypothetical protein
VEQQVSMSKYMPKPESPREIKLTYQALGSHGRMEDRVVVQSLPEECTVQKLIDMCYSIVAASPRQPLELHYWGRLLEPSKLLRDYALKPHSELKVVIRPKLPVRRARIRALLDQSLKERRLPHVCPAKCDATLSTFSSATQRSLLKGPAADLSLLRMVSSKLALPLVIDNITSETTGAELKVLASAQIKREAIWFCRQTADDPEACEKAGTMPIKQGEQLTTEAGAKASLRMRRVWLTPSNRPTKAGNGLYSIFSRLQHDNNCPAWLSAQRSRALYSSALCPNESRYATARWERWRRRTWHNWCFRPRDCAFSLRVSRLRTRCASTAQAS